MSVTALYFSVPVIKSQIFLIKRYTIKYLFYMPDRPASYKKKLHEANLFPNLVLQICLT